MLFVLALLLVLLIALVLSFRDPLGERVLVTVATPQFDSAVIPPLEFVVQDLERVRAAPGVDLQVAEGDTLANFSTTGDLEELRNNVLPSIAHDTLIVFVRAHAAIEGDELFLITSDVVDPLHPAQGVGVSAFLESVALAPARHKLLLVDIGQVPHRLPLGWLGGDLRSQLTTAFESVAARVDGSKMVLICGRIDGRAPTGSPAVQQSVFGGLAAYCLYGGAEANGAGPAGKGGDSILSAAEVASYLEQSAGAWTLTNTPSTGDPLDFAVAGVDELLSRDRFFAGREPLSRAGEAENERRRQAAQQPSSGGSAATGDSGNSGTAQLVPVTEAVVSRLRQSWQRREDLRSTAASTRRPQHWALYHQYLLRAEMLLLAGQVEAADAVLVNDVTPLEKDLDVLPAPIIRYPWSLAYRELTADAEITARWGQALQAAIDVPTRPNLERLRGAPLIELEMLRRASAALVTGSTAEDAEWTDAKVLERALATRLLAEQMGRLLRRPSGAAASADAAAALPAVPELLSVIRGRIAAADRLRVAAEHEMYIGRTELAEERFESASAEYLKVAIDADRLDRQLQSLHTMLVESAAFSEWLAATRLDSAWRAGLASRFAALLRGAAEFRRNPQPERLTVLADLCEDLRRAARSTAREAAVQRDASEMRAALELPFLDPELRSEIVWALIRRTDAPGATFVSQQAADGEGAAVPSNSGPYPLREWADALAVDLPGGVSAPTLRSALSTLMGHSPLDLPPGRNGYEQFVNHLARAPFQTSLLRLTRFQPTATNAILARMTVDQLEWHVDRLRAEAATTAVDVSGPSAVIQRNLRESDPAYQESRQRPPTAFQATTPRESPGDSPGRSELTVSVQTPLDLTDADDPHFVVDWFTVRQSWQVLALSAGDSAEGLAAGTTVGDWRLRVPLRDLTTSKATQVRIDLLSMAAAEGSTPRSGDELAGWIELADGSRYWMPVPLIAAAVRRRPLEIALTGPDGAPLPDRLRLFPNQRLPVKFQVRGKRTGDSPLTIQVSSGGKAHSLEARATADSEWTGAPAALELPVLAAELQVQALSGGEVAGERTFVIEIMNPRTSFAADVTYEADTRTITAVLRRLATAAAAAAVPAQLSVTGATIEGGSLEGEMAADGDEVTLQAVLGPGSPSPVYYVAMGACGVPGMFRYEIDAVSGLVSRTSQSHVEINSPEDGTAFIAALDRPASLPVAVSADAEGPGQLHVGIDRDGDGYLHQSERLVSRSTWSGKTVTTRLVSTTEPPEFVIDSLVSDVAATIPIAGLVGPQRVLAQLVTGNQLPTASRTVYFVPAPPAVTIAAPRQNDAIAFGDPFTVSIASSDPSFRAISQVEVGVDRNNNGKWDDGETLTSIDVSDLTGPPFTAAGTWTRTFDSLKLPEEATAPSAPAPAAATGAGPAAGNGAASAAPATSLPLPMRLVLMARAVTPVHDLIDPAVPVRNDVSEIVRRTIRLVSPDDRPPPTGQISGYVITVDGLRQRGVEIKLGELVTQTDDDGRFLLREVPPGMHVVKASRGLRTGELEVEIVAGQTTSDVEIAIAR